jgi:hypothetical protein
MYWIRILVHNAEKKLRMEWLRVDFVIDDRSSERTKAEVRVKSAETLGRMDSKAKVPCERLNRVAW